jgi:hypothetical protein
MTRFAVNRSLTSRLIVLCACLIPAEVWAQSNPYAWLTGQLALTPEIQTRIINAIDAQAAAKSPTAPARPAVEAQKRSDPARAGRPGRQRHGCEAAHVARIRRRQARERREDRRRPVIAVADGPVASRVTSAAIAGTR